jgi:uncharacterized phage infection (PIP) family protein YhgE
MLGLDSIGTAIKAVAALLAVAAVAGALWYVSHLRGQVADQAKTIDNLNASVAVANAAAAESAKAAQEIARSSAESQSIVADTHAATESLNAAIQSITQEVALAPASDKTCPVSRAGIALGLPPALVRAADELFQGSAADRGPANDNGQDQGPAGAAVVPPVAIGK